MFIVKDCYALFHVFFNYDVFEIVKNAARHMDVNEIFQWNEVYHNKSILVSNIEKQGLYAMHEMESYSVLLS
jgi:hypothetical protein